MKALTEDEKAEIVKIKIALRALLRRIHTIDLRANRKSQQSPPVIAATPFVLTKMSEVEWTVRSVYIEPERSGCKLAIELLGQRLYEITRSSDAMLKIAESVCGRKNYGRNINIIDKTWDGIGDWHA